MTDGRAGQVRPCQGKVDPGDCSYPRIQQSKARGILKSSRGYGCWENGPSEKRKGPRSKQSPYGNKTMKEMVKVLEKKGLFRNGRRGQRKYLFRGHVINLKWLWKEKL